MSTHTLIAEPELITDSPVKKEVDRRFIDAMEYLMGSFPLEVIKHISFRHIPSRFEPEQTVEILDKIYEYCRVNGIGMRADEVEVVLDLDKNEEFKVKKFIDALLLKKMMPEFLRMTLKGKLIYLDTDSNLGFSPENTYLTLRDVMGTLMQIVNIANETNYSLNSILSSDETAAEFVGALNNLEQLYGNEYREYVINDVFKTLEQDPENAAMESIKKEIFKIIETTYKDTILDKYIVNEILEIFVQSYGDNIKEQVAGILKHMLEQQKAALEDKTRQDMIDHIVVDLRIRLHLIPEPGQLLSISFDEFVKGKRSREILLSGINMLPNHEDRLRVARAFGLSEKEYKELKAMED